MSSVQKRYEYKVYRAGVYMGNLPNVTSEFNFSQDINTAGSQMTITCAVSADVAVVAEGTVDDESAVPLQDESGNSINQEDQYPIVGLGSNTSSIIRNGNQVIVYEYSSWNPNGKAVFRGIIQRWEADFGGPGGADNSITILIYSDGTDLSNYIVAGSNTLVADQSQLSQNDFASSSVGQSFVAGVGVTNLAAIDVTLDVASGSDMVTMYVFNGPPSTDFTTAIASVSQAVTATTATVYQFVFPVALPVTAGTTYSFIVDDGNNFNNNTNFNTFIDDSKLYANGTLYIASRVGGVPTWLADTTQSLYFKTYYTQSITSQTFTNVDPVAGYLKPILNAYISQGGKIGYSSSTVVNSPLSLTLQTNTNTVYEAMQQALSVAPSTYYYYVDLGTDTLYFKAASTTADVKLLKDYHISKMRLIATIEQIINTVYFTGGLVMGSNIYTYDKDATSASQFGIFLDRPTNNLVTTTTTAHQIGSAEIARLKNEQFQTSVTITDNHMDISTLKPGQVIGFQGFGSFVDNMLLQVVRVDYTPHEATLTLGLLPKRIHQAVQQVVSGYVGLQTVVNPSSPS